MERHPSAFDRTRREYMIRVSSMLFFFNMAVGLIAGTDNQGKAIDTQCSSLTIHVGKAGIFSAVAHEHWVNAPIASGTVNDTSAAPAVIYGSACNRGVHP